MGATVAGGLAGCQERDRRTGQAGTLTVRVSNRREDAQRVTVTVRTAEGEVRKRLTNRSVRPGVTTTVDTVGYGSGHYTVAVVGEDWAASGVWNGDDCQDHVFRAVLAVTDGTPAVRAETACATGDRTHGSATAAPDRERVSRLLSRRERTSPDTARSG